LPTGARADGPPPEAVDAQGRYDQAATMLAQQRYDVACPTFDDVARLVPGSNAANASRAECYLRAGRLATALARYSTIEAEAVAKGESARAAQVRARVESLRARVAHLVLALPEPVKRLPGLEIRFDGVLLDPSQVGAPMPLDKGTHRVEVTATGREPLVETIEIAEDGETSTLAVAMPIPIVPPPPPPRSPEPPSAPRGSPSRASSFSALARRPWGSARSRAC
jgi:hypothetical protein